MEEFGAILTKNIRKFGAKVNRMYENKSQSNFLILV